MKILSHFLQRTFGCLYDTYRKMQLLPKTALTYWSLSWRRNFFCEVAQTRSVTRYSCRTACEKTHCMHKQASLTAVTKRSDAVTYRAP